MRAFNFGIVDEVDSILIDEARTPLIISGTAGDIAFLLLTFCGGKEPAEMQSHWVSASTANEVGSEPYHTCIKFSSKPYTVERRMKIGYQLSKYVASFSLSQRLQTPLLQSVCARVPSTQAQHFGA